MQSKTQWERRVWVVKVIYMIIIANYSKEEIVDICLNSFGFNVENLKIIESYFQFKHEIINNVNKNSKADWDFDRLNYVDQAIIFQSCLEQKVLNTHRNILIDQAIITSKKYCDNNSFQYINAILEKVLAK